MLLIMHKHIKKYLGSIRNRSRYGIALLLMVFLMVSCRKEVTNERLTELLWQILYGSL